MKNQSNPFEIDSFESHINSDPILRYNLREAKLDYNLLDHQVGIQIASFKIALHQYLDKKYPTS